MSETREHFIGIDFGTSKCVTTVYNPRSRTAQVVRNAEREERTPSAVLYHSDGRILVGRPALTECEINEEERPNLVLSCKRHIADDDYQYDVPGDPTARQAATEIFRKLHRDLAHEFGFLPTRAVVTVPAIFTPVQRLAIREAARAGGFTEVELLEEPVAAAITYTEQGFHPGQRFLIYDLGAGTFDLALLRLAEARPDGKPVYEQALPPMGLRFGGDDIDEAVYGLLDRKCREAHRAPLAGDGRQKTHLLFRCRLQKELLSGGTVTPFSYLSPTLQQRLEFTITREEFDTLVAEQILRTVEPVLHMIDTARRKLGLPDKGAAFPLDDLVLVGGSTELRQIPELLEAELHAPLKHVREWSNRDVAVALGAAYQAYRLWGTHRPLPPSLLSTLEAIRTEAAGTVPDETPPDASDIPSLVNPWANVVVGGITPANDAPPGISESDFGGGAPVKTGTETTLLPDLEVTAPTGYVEPPTLAAYPQEEISSAEATGAVKSTSLAEAPTEDESLKESPQSATPPPMEEKPAPESLSLPQTETLPAPFPGAPPIVAARLAVVVSPLGDEASRTPGSPIRVALFVADSGVRGANNGNNGHAPAYEPREIGQGFLARGVETTTNVRLGRCKVYAQLDDGSPAQEFSIDCAFTAVYTMFLRYDMNRRTFTQNVEPGPALTETAGRGT
jgi:hypothetical protein